jgi:hypothetical protein
MMKKRAAKRLGIGVYEATDRVHEHSQAKQTKKRKLAFEYCPQPHFESLKIVFPLCSSLSSIFLFDGTKMKTVLKIMRFVPLS